MAAKRTADLIPLCHPLPLTKVEVRIELDDELPGFRVVAEVRTKAVTGVEMEALTAVSVACLTLFDMLKAIDRRMAIGGIAVGFEDRRQVRRLAPRMISFDEAVELVRSIATPLGTRDGAHREGCRTGSRAAGDRRDRFPALGRLGDGRLCGPGRGPEQFPASLRVVGGSFAGARLGRAGRARHLRPDLHRCAGTRKAPTGW